MPASNSRDYTPLYDRGEALAVPLSLLKEEFPYGSVEENADSARRALESRIAELITEADAEIIKKDDVLMHFLRDNLIAKGFISKGQGEAPGISKWSDRQLHSTWQAGTKRAGEALGEAVKRGLPWVPEALQELSAYPAVQMDFLLVPAGIEFARTSDFPNQGNRTDTLWLLQHGTRIRWDAAAKRWVLPSP